MSSRTIATVVTSDTIALNAAVFGYAGHSIVTPQFAIKQIWWTGERVQEKITREFVFSKLKSEERERLGEQVAFGVELTDLKYIDWILEKTKRLFLILVEIGVADQIFAVIDNAWDDTDLPIPLEDVNNLALKCKPHDDIHRKFFSVQYQFLLRPLLQDSHIQYGSNETIPLEYIHKMPAAAAIQGWLKMHLPKQPQDILVRRKVTLGTSNEKADEALEAQFRADIQTSKLVQHKHVSSVWASYTSKGTGYFLTTFEAEHTLKSSIDFRSAASLQKLTKNERNKIFLTWLHCLADALASIHRAGLQHTAITPSNILIDSQNQIAFSDIGSLQSFQSDKKADPAEIYNYSAPEIYNSNAAETFTVPFHNVSREALRSSPTRFHRYKRSIDSTKSSLSKVHSNSSNRTSSLYSMASSPDMSAPGLQTPSASSISSMESPETPTSDTSPTKPTRAPPPLPKDDIYIKQAAAIADTMHLFNVRHSTVSTAPSTPDLPRELSAEFQAQLSDIFSLGCIFLDILTYMVKKKLGDFIKHRTTKRRPERPSTPSVLNKQYSPLNAKTDSSFQHNLSQVIAWTEQLQAEAAALTDPTFTVVPRLIRLVRCMISPDPALRPNALEVRDRLMEILTAHAGIDQVCCQPPVGAVKPVPKLEPAPKGNKAESKTVEETPEPAQHQQQTSPEPKAEPALIDNSVSPTPKRANTTASLSRDAHHGLGGLVRGFRWGSRKATA